MLTADQLIAHAIGDFLLQSDWMAHGKKQNLIPALVHSALYTLPFILITQSPMAISLIFLLHLLVNRFNIAKYFVWLKNWPWPGSKPWKECNQTGYPNTEPPWLSTWLLTITDALIHIILNGLCIRYF